MTGLASYIYSNRSVAMKKSKLFIVVSVIFVSLFFIASCSVGTVSPTNEAQHNADVEARPVNLTPSEALELDTSVPVQAISPKAISTSMAKVIILMYHNISSDIVPGDYDRDIADFENDLIYLKNNNIKIISLEDILKIQSGQLVPPEGQRMAAITFDDGFISMYTKAFPILKKYNTPATFFVITSFVGSPGFLTWNQIKTMSDYKVGKGKNAVQLFDFGSHTVDHQSLAYDETRWPNKNDYIVFLNMELNQSRKAIQEKIKQPKIFLALPYGAGAFEPEVKNAAIRTGYSGIRTSEYGSAFAAFNAYNTDWNYRLPSRPVYGSTDISIIPPYFDWEWLY